MSGCAMDFDPRAIKTITAGPHLVVDLGDDTLLIRGVWEYQQLITREAAAFVWVETSPDLVHCAHVELDRIRIMPGRPS